MFMGYAKVKQEEKYSREEGGQNARRKKREPTTLR
jgi:hypothetical protein